jgi:hypothetical protein
MARVGEADGEELAHAHKPRPATRDGGDARARRLRGRAGAEGGLEFVELASEDVSARLVEWGEVFGGDKVELGAHEVGHLRER